MIESMMSDAEVLSRVQKVWALVFAASNKVLVDEKRFGFLGMDVIPDPNIHQMMVLLRAINAALVSIPDEFEGLQYEENRLILNAREQITRMEMVAAALKANDRAGFDEAIRKLEEHAPF